MNPRKTLLAFLAILFSTGSPSAAEEISDGERASTRLTAGFSHYLGTLDAEQKAAVSYAFDDEERFDLRLAPLGLEGLRVDEMSEAQWIELEASLATVLSPVGLSKMNTIRSLEREVAETEGGLIGFLMQRIRSAGRYFLTIYGEPKLDEAWGLRFDGHHFSLNWTAVPDAPLSVTPVFWGSQPRVVPEDLERAGLRVLTEEENRAITFIYGLDLEQRSAARLSFFSGSGIRRPMSVAGEVPLSLKVPAGIPRAALSAEQQAQLDAIIDVQLDNFVPEIASRYRARIAEDAATIHFAYATPEDSAAVDVDAGHPLYYRIQGARTLIEYDNTSNEADHVHVVWREIDGDFGIDVLAEHWAEEHAADALSADGA